MNPIPVVPSRSCYLAILQGSNAKCVFYIKGYARTQNINPVGAYTRKYNEQAGRNSASRIQKTNSYCRPMPTSKVYPESKVIPRDLCIPSKTVYPESIGYSRGNLATNLNEQCRSGEFNFWVFSVVFFPKIEGNRDG